MNHSVPRTRSRPVEFDMHDGLLVGPLESFSWTRQVEDIRRHEFHGHKYRNLTRFADSEMKRFRYLGTPVTI